MSSLHHVEGALTQPHIKKIKGHGQPQTQKQPEVDRQEIKNVLTNAWAELSNAMANYRAAFEDETGSRILSGSALSADLGAKFSLECLEYLLRRI